jgi:DNA-binding transcriptional MerR regulator
MTEPEGGADYPIAAVSKLTGISCHALRVWERRYGFPVPHRSESGHRRYGHDQVRILRRVAELSHQGRSIRELIADLRAGRVAAEGPPAGQPSGPRGAARADELMGRLLQGDLAGGEACFQRLARELEPSELVLRVIEPSLVDAGERWFRHECDVFQEHCACAFLRRKLDALIDGARRENGRPRHTIAIGTVQGDRHEGGVLIVHWFLERAGWRVVNLGVDLPVRELQKAVDTWRPDALGVSFILSRNINKRFQELSRIGALPVFVGGRSILNYQGLARKHGLIPLPGPVPGAVDQLATEYEAWAAARGARRSHESPPER